jgi:hypothetical protein
VERLEFRNVPGSALRLSALGADLGVLYLAALAPATQFEDLAQATRGAAVPAPANVSDGPPAAGQALAFDNPLHRQAFQDVLSGGLPAARTQAPPGPQAAAGADPLSQAVQALAGGGKGTQGAPLPPNQVFNGDFSMGADGLAGWTVGNPNDPYVFANWVYGLPGLCGATEAWLGTVGATNDLTQSVATPANFYRISFDLANDDANLPPGPESFIVLWNPVTAMGSGVVFRFVETGAFPCTHFASPPLYTTQPFSTLSFSEQNDPGYWHLTNVSVA